MDEVGKMIVEVWDLVLVVFEEDNKRNECGADASCFFFYVNIALQLTNLSCSVLILFFLRVEVNFCP